MMHKTTFHGAAMRLSIVLALSLLMTSETLAATPDNEEAFTLGEVVVTAKTGGVEATQAVNEVTSEDIKARNAKTLDEAIQLLPGLNVRNGGEGVPRIDIRGLRTRQILLLLDGIPINSAVDQQFDPTTIPVENIAKIKLTTGPSSVLYGQGGLAGVINIITKKGTKDVRAGASYEAGDRQSHLGKAYIGGIAGKFDLFLSGSAYKVNSFPLSGGFIPTVQQGTGYRGNSDHERNNLFGNIGFQATKDLSLALTINYVQGKYGKPSSIIPAALVAKSSQTLIQAFNNGLDVFASNPKYERVEGFDAISLQLSGEYTPSGPFSIRTWAYLNRQESDEKGYDDNTYTIISKNGSYDISVRSMIQGFTMQPKLDLGRAGVLTASFNMERDDWDNNGITIGKIGKLNNQMITADLQRGFDLFSLAVQYEVEPVKNLGLVAGYGHYWQNRAELSDDNFSVMAGIHYDLFTGTRFKAVFQRNIRFPSLEQLYSVNGGNAALRAERTYQYEVGVEQKLPGNSLLTLTGFRTDAKNFIEKDSSSINRNYQEYRFYGCEVAAQTRFIDNLTLRASYSYLDSQDKSANATRDELQYRPKNKVAFEGWYDFAFGLTPYVSVQYVANQVTYDRLTDTIAHKMNDYTLVNVKLNQKLLKGLINLYFGVNNLFDENYETSYGYPQAGRFIYGGLGIRI